MILEAVYDFITTYASNVVADNVFRGWQNRMALPQTQNFIVISIQDTMRIGTNVVDYTQSAQGNITNQTLREYTVDIDFCNIDQEIAQEQASTIETLGRSDIGVTFFNNYTGLSLNYADDMEYMPYVDEQDQYLPRYRVSLHLTQWDQTTLTQDYFNSVNLRVENIDTHHKP